MAEFAFNPGFSETLDLSSAILQLSELGRCLKQYSLWRKKDRSLLVKQCFIIQQGQKAPWEAKNKKDVKTKQRLDLNYFVSHLCHISFYWHLGAGVEEGNEECAVQPWSSGKHHW